MERQGEKLIERRVLGIITVPTSFASFAIVHTVRFITSNYRNTWFREIESVDKGNLTSASNY